MQKKCLVLVVIVTLLAWTGAVMATPLTFEEYYAHTEAGSDTDNKLQYETPVSAYSISSDGDAEASATVPDPTELDASAESWGNDSSASRAYATAAGAIREYTATTEFPQLRITCNYTIHAEVDGNGSGEEVYARAYFAPKVVDETLGYNAWFLPELIQFSLSDGGESSDTKSDSIDVVIDLDPGHDYFINFYDLKVETIAYEGQYAYAWGEVTGIDLQLVPLPSTLLLASSGLLGLLALRRKRKF